MLPLWHSGIVARTAKASKSADSAASMQSQTQTQAESGVLRLARPDRPQLLASGASAQPEAPLLLAELRHCWLVAGAWQAWQASAQPMH